MPKYSFIVPVYGCEKYLAKCVESILNQKGDHDLEVILVEDGSRDRSGQIADELSHRDSRVRTFHKENGGAASARNVGLREAKGEYILFIDGDDMVEDGLLQAVDATLGKDPDALIIFGMSFDYYRGQTCVRTQILGCSHEGSYTIEQLLTEYKSFFYDNALSSACNKVFSAKTIQSKGLWMKEGMTLYEDYDFVLRYITCVEEVACIAYPFYHYRNDLAVSHLNQRISDMDKLQDNMRQLLSSVRSVLSDSAQLREATANLYMLLLWNHLKTGHYTISELERYTVQYCAEPAFRTLLTEQIKMGDFESSLLQKIENRAFEVIARQIKRTQIIGWLKNSAKQMLGAFGIKRC